MQIKVTIAGVPSDNGATNGRNVVEQFRAEFTEKREKREVGKREEEIFLLPLVASRRVFRVFKQFRDSVS